jgi:type IV secretory pathway VirB2 component (pilin)
MTAMDMNAKSTARRAANSKTLERLARAGLIAFGITHILLAWLALQIAFGKAPATGDQTGAFATVAKQPGGKFLLIVIAIAFVGLMLWQGLEAVVGGASGGVSDKERMVERVASAGRAVLYAVLAWNAFKTATGGTQSSASKQQQATQSIMHTGGGRFLIGLIGLAIIVIAGILVWYGLTDRYARKLWRNPRWVRNLARLGYPSKGVAIGTVGVLMMVAAVTYDPSKSRGLDAALRALADAPFGKFILLVVALGIAAYGVYCFAQAKYRRI